MPLASLDLSRTVVLPRRCRVPPSKLYPSRRRRTSRRVQSRLSARHGRRHRRAASARRIGPFQCIEQLRCAARSIWGVSGGRAQLGTGPRSASAVPAGHGTGPPPSMCDGVGFSGSAAGPAVVMVCGTQGSGKTTTCAKLAMSFQMDKQKKVRYSSTLRVPLEYGLASRRRSVTRVPLEYRLSTDWQAEERPLLAATAAVRYSQ